MSTLFYGGINAGYISIMALPLMLIVVTGEIDIFEGLGGSAGWHFAYGTLADPIDPWARAIDDPTGIDALIFASQTVP